MVRNPEFNNDSGIDNDTNDDVNSTDNRFENDVMILKDYCYISTNEEGNIFEIYKLIQLSTKK